MASANDVASFSRLSSIAAGVVSLAGGLYSIGLMIVNIDLGRYGVVSVDLARPEYVLAGAAWFILAASPTPAFLLGGAALTKIGSKTGRTALLTVTIITSLCIPYFLLEFASVPGYKVATSLWINLAVVLLNTGALLIVSLIVRSAIEVYPLKALLALRSPIGVLTGVMMLLWGISLYSTLVFPDIERAFGGGRKSYVELRVSENKLVEWERFQFPISEDGNRIGPVVLLLETSDSLVVIRPKDRRELGLIPTGAFNVAISIDKKRILAVVYLPTWMVE